MKIYTSSKNKKWASENSIGLRFLLFGFLGMFALGILGSADAGMASLCIGVVVFGLDAVIKKRMSFPVLPFYKYQLRHLTAEDRKYFGNSGVVFGKWSSIFLGLMFTSLGLMLGISSWSQ
jgi:Flp pilus assembly protein protease CpaA